MHFDSKCFLNTNECRHLKQSVYIFVKTDIYYRKFKQMFLEIMRYM